MIERNYRFERKFLITDLDRYKVETIIKLNSMNFTTLYPPRKINNVYFDTLGMKSFFQNIDGTADREKYRIRWYGDTYGHISKPILEKKIKKGIVGTKEFYPLLPFKIDEFSSNANFREIFIKSKLPNLIKEDLVHYSPKVLSGYVRKHFISYDNKFRITLDNDLFYIKSEPITNNSFANFFDRKGSVIEIKYDLESEN